MSVGNHENSAGNLAHFTERFRNMPSNSGTVETENKPGLAPNNWYFSWDAGLVHYVAMSTELYFGVSGGPDGTLEKMFDWIEKDLAAANANRANVPWIVVHGHRSIYCSCDGDCDGPASTVKVGVKQSDGSYKYGMEDVLFKHGVDFFINGHEHDYERSWPVYQGKSDQNNVDPKGTIYVVRTKSPWQPNTCSRAPWCVASPPLLEGVGDGATHQRPLGAVACRALLSADARSLDNSSHRIRRLPAPRAPRNCTSRSRGSSRSGLPTGPTRLGTPGCTSTTTPTCTGSRCRLTPPSSARTCTPG